MITTLQNFITNHEMWLFYFVSQTNAAQLLDAWNRFKQARTELLANLPQR